MVKPIVAMMIPHCSPHMRMARKVAKAVAAMFTKLLPSRIVDRSFSGRSIILATRLAPVTLVLTRSTRLAPVTLVLTRCSILIRCREVKAVSELEKKADKRRQIKRNTRYSVSMLDIWYHPALILVPF